MTFNNERRIARDAQGRVYQERWYPVPKGGQIKSTMNWIQIADPNHLTLYNCSTEQRICDLVVYDPTNSLSALSPHKDISGPLPQGGGNVVWEDLGKRTSPASIRSEREKRPPPSLGRWAMTSRSPT